MSNRDLGIGAGSRDQALLDYWKHLSGNREVFLLSHGELVPIFHDLLARFEATWRSLAEGRDRDGRSHVGLLWLTTIVERQAVLAFSHLMCFQAYVGWMLFRPALEAFLMVGVWVDDPAEAEVWRNRDIDRRAYMRSFSRERLGGSSLPNSSDLADVLMRLNDRFLHPNPDFAATGRIAEAETEHIAIAMSFFDLDRAEHLAHTLSFLSVFEVIVTSSMTLVYERLGYANPPELVGRRVPEILASQRTALIADTPRLDDVFVDLGLWTAVGSDNTQPSGDTTGGSA